MDSIYMNEAYEQAKKSDCSRAKVGCVIVRDNVVIAAYAPKGVEVFIRQSLI